MEKNWPKMGPTRAPTRPKKTPSFLFYFIIFWPPNDHPERQPPAPTKRRRMAQSDQKMTSYGLLLPHPKAAQNPIRICFAYPSELAVSGHGKRRSQRAFAPRLKPSRSMASIRLNMVQKVLDQDQAIFSQKQFEKPRIWGHFNSKNCPKTHENDHKILTEGIYPIKTH